MLAFASFVPPGEVTLGHIDHVADHVAHLPLGATRLHVPVGRVVDDIVKLVTLAAYQSSTVSLPL